MLPLFLAAVIPDFRAMRFFLINRDPDNWRDVKSTKSEVSVQGKLIVGKSELADRIKPLEGNTEIEDEYFLQ